MNYCARERHLGEKSFVVPLGESDCDRYRLHCTTERGQATIFRVQYEAFIVGEWWPIVRYATGHGYSQRDLLRHDRPEEKTEYPGRSNAEVLTLGQEDIKRNWRTLRVQHEKMNKCRFLSARPLILKRPQPAETLTP